MNSWEPNSADDTLFQIALDEDLGIPWQDLTSDLMFSRLPASAVSKISSKNPEKITVCGLNLMPRLISKLTSHFQILSDYADGDVLNNGEVLLTLISDPRSLLKAERVVLNFLRHCCGIATLTAKYVDKVSHTKMKILDTRKTTPGLRHIEKYAVSCGGGVNHRMGLYDALMIKDTHIDFLGGMEKALEKLPLLHQESLPVIVEVRNQQELNVVLSLGQNKLHRVLLDNMDTGTLRECVKACRGVFETEASGNIRLDTIAEVAETGVDFASVGELTYGAGHVDLSMRSIYSET